MVNVARQPTPTLERYMSRTIRYAVLALAVASATACSASVTEPTAAPKCTTTSQNGTTSCLSLDYINPKI
jgi:hypothetical protein